jgi:hypothetical protein
MIDPHADPAAVRRLVVDAIGNDLAQRLVGKVVALDLFGLSLGVPLAAAITELAYQFFLLGINRDHGLPLFLERLGPAVDVRKLRIPIRVGAPLQRLAVGLETIAQVMEEAVDRPLTHRMALRLECRGQLGGTLAGPPQERHRVATGHWIDQGF